MEKALRFRQHLTKRFNWDFESEPEEFAPVVVETWNSSHLDESSLKLITVSDAALSHVHTTKGGIWKRSFHFENASNVFRPHYAGGIFKKVQQSQVTLDLRLRKTRAGKSHDCCDAIVSERPRFQLAFCVHTRKRKAGVFKFLRFEERFRKSPFLRRISVDGRPNRRNKAAFENLCGVMWMLS